MMETRHLNPSVLTILSMDSAWAGRELAKLTGHKGAVNFVEFSRDGRHVVTASDDGTARVWRADGSKTLAVLKGHTKPLESAEFSPDGQCVVTASDDGTARVWHTDGSGIPVVLEGHTKPVMSASFSPDGQHVVTASRDGTARVWRADGSGTPVVLEGHSRSVYTAVFSPDGQRVVTASDDGTARLWRADGRGTSLPGHEKPVRTAAFSPNGKWLASAGDDGKLILWSVEKTEPLEILPSHVGKIYHVVFSPNGKTLASASEDGTVILWNCEPDKTIEPHLKAILEHIEKHYVSDLNSSSSSRGGIPTLLGSLMVTLDTTAKFGYPETSNQAKRLRTDVIHEYEKIRLRANPPPDSECRPPNAKVLDSREFLKREVTNWEYWCFYPGHSFSPNEAHMPVQVNWYEARAYAAYQRTTLPYRASVDDIAIPEPKGAPENASSLNRSSSTWCMDMDIARDEKQFFLLFVFSSLFSPFKSTSPCLAKGSTALLKEKRKFNIAYALSDDTVVR